MTEADALPPAVMECEAPAGSVLGREWLADAWFHDAYRVPLRHRPGARMTDIFCAIFEHHPWWMKAVLIARNRIASWCGLEAASAAEMLRFEHKENYRVGDKIGVWPIFHLSENELVAGRDNRHLDFRLSVLREPRGECASATVSTLCKVHNRYGKIYLFFIIPFHKWGVRLLLGRALAANRL